MLTVHALRIELTKSYHVAVDLLSELPGVLEEIGLTRLRIRGCRNAVYQRHPLDYLEETRREDRPAGRPAQPRRPTMLRG